MVELWTKYTPKICNILQQGGREEASTGIKDKKADKAEQEDRDQNLSIWYCRFPHGRKPLNVQIVYKTPWTFRPLIYKLSIQAYYQTMYMRNMNIS